MAYDPEVTGLDLLHKTKSNKLRQVPPPPDLAKVSEGVEKLEIMLNAVIQVRMKNLKFFGARHFTEFLPDLNKCRKIFREI